MEEENKEKKENIISEGDFKHAKQQWLYKSIVVVVAIMLVAIVISSSITYYVTIGNKFNKLYKSTSNAKDGATKTTATATISDISSVLSTFAEVIDEEYIGEIDKENLIDETIKGFVNGIKDEYSEYMTAEEWEEYQADALGNFVGIGIYMTQETDTNNVVIVSTMKDTPAEKAGIQKEDIIIGVDGESTAGMTTADVSRKVKGEEGTEVTINISRNGERKDFTVKRETIKVYHVETKMLENNIGYISLLAFDTGCADEFAEGVQTLISEGATKLIIDLRDNTGGLVDEALEILNLFLEKDQITLITKSADGTEKTNKATGDKKFNGEIAILVNEYTASASEIVTGALKDNGKAKVIGTLTYGKGVIQNVYQLLDGSVLKLTTQEYYTPNNTKINKVGIKPDYEVEITEENVKNQFDSQLKKAEELLK